ncbi:crystallin J1A-like [Asterias amurensis]|uniref:crystallin J1A-like n=1 Tax=Asterias amurensis TaxID=7602 RepID=UPI003AB3DD48
MSSVTSRAVGAVVGGFIADAAGLPIHWVYNQDDLNAIVAKHDKPEFIPEGHCPYYKLPTGSLSGFADQGYALLQSLVESKGLDLDNYKSSLVTRFGPGSGYDIDRSGEKPVLGPWLNGSLKQFLANHAEKKAKTGADSADVDSLSKVGPLVALYAGDPKLMSYVESTVRVTQDNDIAVKYAQAGAKLLEDYILNGPNPDAVQKLTGQVDADAKAEIEAVIAVKGEPHQEVAKKFGLGCGMPANFNNAIHCILNGSDDFAASVRFGLASGGDNCGRLSFVGSCFGAQGGFESLPADWIAKTTEGAKLKALAEELVKMRK